MKRILNSPIFYYSRGYFTGDNVAHFLPVKYLWHVCNESKTGFHQPVHGTDLTGPVEIDLMFYPEHPLHLYFKKPKWINNFVVAKDEAEARKIAKGYDYFINNYRYRGAVPSEENFGYSKDLNTLELYLVAYHHKAIYEHDLYIDDLELEDKYQEFLSKVKKKINPEKKPMIALHHRGDDPWKRHLGKSIKLYEELLFGLMEKYPDHVFVLLGESWKYYHPRIKYLESYINPRNLKKELKEYSAGLQYILASYFCREIELVFIGISGFTLFIESIRPKYLPPPIPIFWGPQTFSGIDTCIASRKGWRCDGFEDYKKAHPEDIPFQYYIHHFIYYSRDEELLKEYCFDYPNTLEKVLKLLQRIEKKYKLKPAALVENKPIHIKSTVYSKFVNLIWTLGRIKAKILSQLKWKTIAVFRVFFGIKIRP